jgi:hypothetical protein
VLEGVGMTDVEQLQIKFEKLQDKYFTLGEKYCILAEKYYLILYKDNEPKSPDDYEFGLINFDGDVCWAPGDPTDRPFCYGPIKRVGGKWVPA